MSALRQLAALVWTALWLRWRLTVVKARRLVGGRPVAAAGPGYHLAPADVPVEGVDYDVDELPPELLARLEDTRAELLDHARSTAVRRVRRRKTRRRRTLSLATAALVTLAALGAGATALITGSTGVPEVDRLLGIYEESLQDPRAPGRNDPGGRDVRVAPAGAGPSMEIPVADGSRRVVAASYVARSADICVALTDVDGGGETGNSGCVAAALLRARLQRDGGVVSGALADREALVLVGFVTATADRVSVRAQTGPLDVRLGSSWEPDATGVGAVRTFVAVESGKPATVDPRKYDVRVQSGGGRFTRIPLH